MKSEIKEKWIQALESGEYKQGRGGLRNADDTYCCLGVLCGVYAKETGVQWGQAHRSINDYRLLDAEMELPDAVKNWAGLNDRNPTIADSNAIDLNDSDELTFPQIAKLIQEHL